MKDPKPKRKTMIEDNFKKTVIEIWTPKPLTNKQTDMLTDAVDKTLASILHDSYAVETKQI